MHRAFGALRGLAEALNRPAAVEHFVRPVGYGLQQIFAALAERRDRALDGRAALFLLLHGGALLLGLPPLGDVFVRADPAATLHRMVGHQQQMAALRVDLMHDGAAPPDRAETLCGIVRGRAKTYPWRPVSPAPRTASRPASHRRRQAVHSEYCALQTTSRSEASNMHSPCTMLFSAMRICSFSCRLTPRQAERPTRLIAIWATTAANKAVSAIGETLEMTAAVQFGSTTISPPKTSMNVASPARMTKEEARLKLREKNILMIGPVAVAASADYSRSGFLCS